MKLLIICVNYQSGKETDGFLRSLASLPKAEKLAVVVVDNSSTSIPYALPRDLGPLEMTLVDPGANLGYFGGAALGLECYLENHVMPTWVMVTNVDVRPCSMDLVDHLEALAGDHNLGVVAPSIRSGLSARDQNPFMVDRPSRWQMQVIRFLYYYYPTFVAYELASYTFRKLRRLFLRKQDQPIVRLESRPIYAPHGACMILSQEFFQRGGSLRYPCFLFGEEHFIAEQSLRLGLECRYVSDLVILHAEHVSTGLIKNRKMHGYVREAGRYFAKTFF